MRSSLRRVDALMRTGAGIAIAMAVMNVAAYAYTMIAARALGPHEYGAFAATMNILLVVTVVSLGLQTTAARRISSDPDRVDHIRAQVLRVTYRVALALGAVLLLLAPVIDRVLRLDNLPMAFLLGPAVVPLTVMGGQAGTLQGERRWRPLGLLFVAMGVPRLALGTLMVWWQPDAFTAMLAVTLTSVAPAAVGWWALRRESRPVGVAAAHRAGPVTRETLRNAATLLAFFALSNVDVILARNVLPEHQAGLYAAGMILAKAMLFLPQFVVIIAFPSMSTHHERRETLLRSLALVVLLGVVAMAGTYVLSWLALDLVGGVAYSAVEDDLWMFTGLGAILAMLQLVVYSIIARQGRRSIHLVWLALGVIVVGSSTVDSRTGLLLWVTLVDTVLLAALVVISLVTFSRDAPLHLRPEESTALR